MHAQIHIKFHQLSVHQVSDTVQEGLGHGSMSQKFRGWLHLASCHRKPHSESCGIGLWSAAISDIVGIFMYFRPEALGHLGILQHGKCTFMCGLVELFSNTILLGSVGSCIFM